MQSSSAGVRVGACHRALDDQLLSVLCTSTTVNEAAAFNLKLLKYSNLTKRDCVMRIKV